MCVRQGSKHPGIPHQTTKEGPICLQVRTFLHSGARQPPRKGGYLGEMETPMANLLPIPHSSQPCRTYHQAYSAQGHLEGGSRERGSKKGWHLLGLNI